MKHRHSWKLKKFVRVCMICNQTETLIGGVWQEIAQLSLFEAKDRRAEK